MQHTFFFRWTYCDIREGQVSHKAGCDGGGHWGVGPFREGGVDHKSSYSKSKNDNKQPSYLCRLGLAASDAREAVNCCGLKEFP